MCAPVHQTNRCTLITVMVLNEPLASIILKLFAGMSVSLAPHGLFNNTHEFDTKMIGKGFYRKPK
jgi:hypothetical protein